LCIDTLGNKNRHCYPLYVGNKYTIKHAAPGLEETHVVIEEHPVSKRGIMAAYNKKCFGLLNSNLDETTLVNEEFEEKYCVPVNKNVCG
jgi:hypothetical protein